MLKELEDGINRIKSQLPWFVISSNVKYPEVAKSVYWLYFRSLYDTEDCAIRFDSLTNYQKELFMKIAEKIDVGYIRRFFSEPEYRLKVLEEYGKVVEKLPPRIPASSS